MAAMLDERFLRVHPRTERWFVEREQCRQCTHVRFLQDRERSGGTIWQCEAVPGGEQKNKEFRTCIAARDETGRCGPEGRLFEEVKDVQALRGRVV